MVDLLVPQSARPGKYSAPNTVTSKQGNFTGSISLRVWNFAVPTSPALKSSACFFRQILWPPSANSCAIKVSPLATNPTDQPLLMKEA